MTCHGESGYRFVVPWKKELHAGRHSALAFSTLMIPQLATLRVPAYFDGANADVSDFTGYLSLMSQLAQKSRLSAVDTDFALCRFTLGGNGL